MVQCYISAQSCDGADVFYNQILEYKRTLGIYLSNILVMSVSDKISDVNEN